MNGWKNRETWLMNLWFEFNSEEELNDIRCMLEEELDEEDVDEEELLLLTVTELNPKILVFSSMVRVIIGFPGAIPSTIAWFLF